MFAGHNKGKRFVRGFGYQYPQRGLRPYKPPICSTCGLRKATYFFADGRRQCEQCFDQGEQKQLPNESEQATQATTGTSIQAPTPSEPVLGSDPVEGDGHGEALDHPDRGTSDLGI